MRTLALLAILGFVTAPETHAAQPHPITADEARQWGRHVVPLPQKMEIAAEMQLKRERIGLSVQQADHPVVKQAVKELRACVGASEGDFQITLQLDGPEASPLDSVPNKVKLTYYHSLLTYTAGRREMIYPLMEKFAAEGRWLGVCPQLTGSVGPVTPFSGAHFVHWRMKEFVEKRVSGFTAYVTPLLGHARFNVEAAAEWSWNLT